MSSNWVLYRCVGYLVGRGVTFGAPLLQPQAANKDTFSVVVDSIQTPRVSAVTEDLGWVAPNSLDHAFVGHRLESVDEPKGLLRQLQEKLKTNGYLVVNVEIGKQEPGVREFSVNGLKSLLGEIGRWEIKGEERQGQEWLIILKKVPGKKGLLPEKAHVGKRACVVRYGAMGDGIIMTPLIRALWEDGYEVTLNITRYCEPVFQGNPFVANTILQEKDAIPNHELGKYWDFWAPRYDRYINLSESLEGGLLKVEGRRDFFTHQAWRHKTCNKNYYDHTLELGGYGHRGGMNGELFFTNAEERRAREFWGPLEKNFTVVWALNGSSHHKVYPLYEPVLKEWLPKHPEARVISTGDNIARLLEFEHPQVIQKAGVWSVRESLIATKMANLVVGPETMMTNAAGCFATPKITILSHSTHENLCKHWENDFCLAPDPGIAPCYPCHQLHYTKESCVIGVMTDGDTGKEIGQGPVCAMGAVSGQRMLERLDEVYELWHTAKRPSGN